MSYRNMGRAGRGLAAAVLIGLLSSVAAAQAPKPAAQAGPATAPSGPGSLTGLWVNAAYRSSERYSERERILLTEDGKEPPLLPAAKALLDQRIKDSVAGNPYANTLSLCLPGGVPQALFAAGGYPIQIVETPTQVIMLFDEQNHFRLIRLNQPHAADPDPTYMGDSVGHWQGDTLVVDTIRLTERTSLDQIGMPHSEDMHLVERYRRTGKDTMEVEFTIDDPKTFSQPWRAKSLLKTPAAGLGMDEYICENNRNLPDASGRQGLQTPGR